jgi:antitoxin MazE
MVTTLRGRSQITLPNDIVKKLNLNTGDSLDISLEDDRIIVKPVLVIDRSQAWFWSKEWQEKEAEVEKEFEEGKISHAKDVSELFEKLDQD